MNYPTNEIINRVREHFDPVIEESKSDRVCYLANAYGGTSALMERNGIIEKRSGTFRPALTINKDMLDFVLRGVKPIFCGDVGYPELSDAVNAVGDNGVIYIMLKDRSYKEYWRMPITIRKPVSIIAIGKQVDLRGSHVGNFVIEPNFTYRQQREIGEVEVGKGRKKNIPIQPLEMMKDAYLETVYLRGLNITEGRPNFSINNSKVILNDCRISQGNAPAGAGINASRSQIFLFNTEITANRAKVGGGIFLDHSTLTMMGGKFEGNLAENGNNWYANMNSSVIINQVKN